eukprot:UN10271
MQIIRCRLKKFYILRLYPVGSEKIRSYPVGSEKVRLCPVGSEKVRTYPVGIEKVRLYLVGSENVRLYPAKRLDYTRWYILGADHLCCFSSRNTKKVRKTSEFDGNEAFCSLICLLSSPGSKIRMFFLRRR